MRTPTRTTLSFFWSHLCKFRLRAIILFAMVTIGLLVTVYIPFLYKRFFDILTQPGPVSDETVRVLLGILVSVFLWSIVKMVLRRTSGFLYTRALLRISNSIAFSSFEYLHDHSYRFFINNFVGSLVTKSRRFVRSFEVLFGKFFWDFMPLLVRTGATLIVLFWLDSRLGWVLVTWLVVFLAMQYAFAIWKQKYEVARAAADTQTTAVLADTITNNINIKLFTGKEQESRTFLSVLQELLHTRRLAMDLNTLADFVRSTLMIGCEFMLMYLGVQLWREGVLTIGDFVLIQKYVFDIFDLLWDFGKIIQEVYEAFADAEEMSEILHTPQEIRDARRATVLAVKKGTIDFKSVAFGYGSGAAAHHVLDRFSLRIHPGEKIALVGPSGAGKTTIIKILFRFFDITGGRILIDDQDIAKVTQESLRGALSLVPQEPILFHRTILENIRYGRRGSSDDEVKRAARLAHCDEFIERLPQGYETYVGERGVKLSGGERQRVAIARAILKNAPVLVLDEATSSLDSHSELLIQDALKELMRGRTTIVIAHRLSTIMQMDRIVVVNDGSILEQGTHAQLLKNGDGLYAKLWHVQAGGFIK